MITIKIKTWTCPECGYKQDFEPTVENMAIHFKGLGLDNECPACASGLNKVKVLKRGIVMAKETNPDKKIVMNIQDTDEEVEEEQPTDDDIRVLGELERKLKLVDDMLELEDSPTLKAKKIQLGQEHKARKSRIPKVKTILKAATSQYIKQLRDRYED